MKEYRRMKPCPPRKYKKTVFVDVEALTDGPSEEEKAVVTWLTAYFDVYIIQTDEYVHLLRGDYLISPVQHEPMFRGEWVCFRLKGSQDADSPQTDWQRVKAFFSNIVEKGENVDDGVSDETALAMLRSQLRYDDDNC